MDKPESGRKTEPSLKEIVERATGSGEAEPERPPRRYKPSHALRLLIGIALFFGGLSGVCLALVHLMHVGTCASGNTPYQIARQCPSGTGMWIGILAGSIFLALIGAGIASVGMSLPMGVGFTVLGAAALYGGLTAPSSAQGATLAGYIVGPIFIVMGLVYLAFAIWMWSSSRKEGGPVLTAAGLSQLIAATAPKPLSGTELSKPEDQSEKGG